MGVRPQLGVGEGAPQAAAAGGGVAAGADTGGIGVAEGDVTGAGGLRPARRRADAITAVAAETSGD